MSWALISWQSVIAGTITTLAISIIMAVLGVALGFTVVKPKSDQPLSGLGTTFGLWSILSVVVSLAAGGFVAGIFSGVRGQEHGFMVWATVLLAATLFGGVAVGSAVRSVGTVVKNVGSGAASVVSTVGGGVSNLAQSAVDQIKESVDLSFDPDQVSDEVASVMRDTGVEHLQPEYLKDQMHEAKSDLRASLHQLRLNSDNYEQVIDDFVGKQKNRLEAITRGIDKNTAVDTLMNHRNMPREEAEKTVDNALKTYQKVVDKSKQSLLDAKRHFDETKDYLRQMGEQAREKADRFSSSAARSALAAGLALIIGAFICSYAGRYGNNMSASDSVFMETRSVSIPMMVPRPNIDRAFERSLDRPMGASMDRP